MVEEEARRGAWGVGSEVRAESRLFLTSAGIRSRSLMTALARSSGKHGGCHPPLFLLPLTAASSPRAAIIRKARLNARCESVA